MTAAHLLDRLKDRGVTLYRDGDRLAYDAPPGVMTPAVLDTLRAAKPALLELLAADPVDAERGALLDDITHLPAEDQLVILGYLCCRSCRRWLLAREVEPRHGQPYCIDGVDCCEAIALRNANLAAVPPASLNQIVSASEPGDAGQGELFESDGGEPVREGRP